MKEFDGFFDGLFFTECILGPARVQGQTLSMTLTFMRSAWRATRSRQVAQSLPRTMSVLEECYGTPVLCLSRGVRLLVPSVLFEGADRNVFGTPHLPDFSELGYFERYVGALPVAMRSLYFATNALQLTTLNYPQIQWPDMLVPIEGRRSLAD